MKIQLWGSLKPLVFLLGLSAIAFPSAALADSLPNVSDFCAARPGQTTPPCVIEPGSAMVEIGLATWEHTKTERVRDNQLTLSAIALRYGIAPSVELQIGWAGLIVSSHFDYATRNQSRDTNPRDLIVGALYGLSGRGGPIAVQAFITLPTGEGAATHGEWSGGVRLPVTIPIDSNWQVGLTPEYNLTVNSSGHGRHSAFGGAAGISRSISRRLGAGIDISVFEDRAPEGSSTSSMASASIAWQTSPNSQLDFGIGLGLTSNSPRAQIYIGLAKRM
jgi:hypothetical protein